MRYIKYVSLSLLTTYLTSYLNSSADTVPDITLAVEPITLTQTYTLAPTQIIAQQEIKNSGARNITEILSTQSNIQLQQLYNGSLAVPSMRGFGDNANQNVLILINGLPLTNPDLGRTMINAIPLSEVKQINILSGSAGVLYGDQAVGGVVNIITRTRHENNFKSAVTAGSYALQQYEASINHEWDNGIVFHIGTSNLKTDNYRDHNNEQKNILQLGLGYYYNNGFLTLRYHFLNNNLQYPGALTQEQIIQNRRQAQRLDDNDFDDQIQNDMTLHWQQAINNEWLTKQGLILQYMHGDGILSDPFTERRNLLEWSPKFLGTFNIGNTTIENQSGILIQSSQYTLVGSNFDNIARQKKQAIFAQFIIPGPHHLKFNAGVRGALSEVSLNEFQFNSYKVNRVAVFDVGLEWQAQPDLLVYARRAGNYRFPKAEENALSKDGKPLATQVGVSYETGIKWHRQKKEISLSLFDVALDNEIMFVPDRAGIFGTNQNLPPTQRPGGTIHIRLPLMTKWQFGGDYTFINARFSSGPNTGKRIPFVALSKATFHSDYHFTPYCNLHAEAIIFGNRFPGGDVTNQGIIVDGYTVFNLSFNYQYKYISFKLTINNITNIKYNNYGQVLGPVNALQTFFYPAPERNFWASLTLKI